MDESKVQIAHNSKLVLYTDGIIEARNAAGEEFGRKRFVETLMKFGANRNADALGLEIIKTVKDYIQDVPFNDDYTLVVLGIE